MHENEFTAYLKESLYKKDLNKIIFSGTATSGKIEELLRKAYIFYKELIEWNKKINLTAITEPSEFIERNIIDSLMVFKILDCGFYENSENLRNNTEYQYNKYDNGCGENNAGIININITKYEDKNILKLLDIGSGAGLPGIILKIFNPDAVLYSIESVLKKSAFQKYAARKLGFENFYCINENIYKIYELPKVNAIITRAAFNVNELFHLIDSLEMKNLEPPVNLILFLTNLKDANTITNGKYGDKSLYIDKILMYKNNNDRDKKFKQIVNFKIINKI
ncbi:MAG: class I SAM-dependent methyltransferase [Deltaproteobacteria bacterium]|uniref:Ribosomal RNA small subunit methyltransferase G n=1 Tax=Acididesulfobacter guangdongensis TaxID=2597225 RepID=A0A519BIT0_ACIG2|nr:class I SAM-dependent methyltransferase [Deltaproteobacteria bacterium]RZD17162.1 MAG: hypothetical protein EVJ46_02735 [Candidatus Acididesulfobacter guangdongensis]